LVASDLINLFLAVLLKRGASLVVMASELIQLRR
jgi:hypothetical protein